MEKRAARLVALFWKGWYSMRKLLLVIDMQRDFVDGALGTAEAVKIVPNVVRKIKTYSRKDVIATGTPMESIISKPRRGRNCLSFIVCRGHRDGSWYPR